MLSLLRWSLGSGKEHLTDEEATKASTAAAAAAATAKRKPRATPNMPSAPAKRKRGNSELSQSLPEHQRPTKRSAVARADNADATTGPINTHPPAHLAKHSNAPAKHGAYAVPTPPASTDYEHETEHMNVIDLISGAATPAAGVQGLGLPTFPTVVDMSAVQQAIESEFCLEILLKHKELRLIDQEIAKCQVSLEQLRRCSIIPYPATTMNAEDMVDVSTGSGMSLRRPAGSHTATDPAPWGVTEGPYSRHYAQWLLPDPAFDGGFVEEVQRPGMRAGKTLPERHTRGSKGEQAMLSSKFRSQRASAGSRLQALPAGYPEAKEEKGPMIVKRASDNKFVKLVCIDCKRENFNSAQGFINHCRIAHGRGFASHEAAAQASGQEVDPAEPATATAASHDAGTAASGAMSAGLVHPLIRFPSSVPKLSMPTPRKQQVKDQQRQPITPASSSVPTASPPSIRSHPVDEHSHIPFMPSSNTPHLSKLFAQSGRGGNLGSFVADATVKEDLDTIMVDEVEDSEEEDGRDDNQGGVVALDTESDKQTADMPSSSRGHAGVRLHGGLLRAGPSRMSPAPGDRPLSRKGVDRGVTHSGAVATTATTLPSRTSQPPSSPSPAHAATDTMTAAAAINSTSTTSTFPTHKQSIIITTTNTADTPRNTTFELLSDEGRSSRRHDDDHDHDHDLSPHTVESNVAPSLVSDSSASSESSDDDDEEVDDDVDADEHDADEVGEEDAYTGRTGRTGRRTAIPIPDSAVVGGDGREDDEESQVGVPAVAGKSDDPELRASGKAKAKAKAQVNARRGGYAARRGRGGVSGGATGGGGGRGRGRARGGASAGRSGGVATDPIIIISSDSKGPKGGAQQQAKGNNNKPGPKARRV